MVLTKKAYNNLHTLPGILRGLSRQLRNCSVLGNKTINELIKSYHIEHRIVGSSIRADWGNEWMNGQVISIPSHMLVDSLIRQLTEKARLTQAAKRDWQ